MNNKKSYVYKITCKITGEFYFGSSFNAKRDWYWGKGRKIKDRVALYGKENFVKEILGEFDDRTESHRVENEYIEKFINDDKCLNIACDHKFGTYSNETCAKNSAANIGKHFSEEHKAKLSASLSGKHLSEEHRAKLSAANIGKHLSDETRAKLSAANIGKHLSDETRAKISATKRGKPNPHGKHWRKNPITGKREYYE